MSRCGVTVPAEVSRSSRRNALAVATLAALVVGAYVWVWLGVDRAHIGLSDFTATYVGATLLDQGHRADLYDDSVQAPLHAFLIAPEREANLPFVNPPTAAALAVPLTRFDLATAYRVFGLIQLGLLVLAVAVAAAPLRPWPLASASGLAGLAGLASLALLLLAQWDGVLALGVALAFHLLKRGRRGTGGLVLAVTAGLAKPHLFLGVAAFVLGWRDRRVIAGAMAGIALMALTDLALVGPGGIGGLVAADQRDAALWPLASLLGWNGLAGSWLGGGLVPQSIAWCFDAGTLLCCAGCGALVGGRRRGLGSGLAAALALSLVASPHLLAHDLVLVAPALIWCLAELRPDEARSWPGPGSQVLLAAWLVVNAGLALDFGNQSPAPPGRLVPLALVGFAVISWRRRARTEVGAAA